MARAKITEYKAKQLLLGGAYTGQMLLAGEYARIPKEGAWVLKVDQGIKRRFKQGLVLMRGTHSQMESAMRDWEKKGFSRFVVEPLIVHESDDEQYVSFERVRDGIRMLHTRDGGIDIESHSEEVSTYLLSAPEDIVAVASASGLPEILLNNIYKAFEVYFFSFVEINPLVVKGSAYFLLDAAILVDTAGEFFVRGAWSEKDLIRPSVKHPAEARVEALDATTPASLKLSVINPHGSLCLLLSAGGGSIVNADEVALLGLKEEMINYGEYSGGPTREETYLYAKEIISLLIESDASKKCLVIAGPVANFTDVKTTFLGIIDALAEVVEILQRSRVKIFVRRGGPNEEAGLALMSEFLRKYNLLGQVYGSDSLITAAVDASGVYLKS